MKLYMAQGVSPERLIIQSIEKLYKGENGKQKKGITE